MNITMLGTTGSGKTCYMSAMSQLFYNGVVHRFHLNDREFSSHIYDNRRALAKIDTILTERRWPDGTGTSTIMEYELTYDGKKILDIDWIDYKGKLVQDIDKGVSHRIDDKDAAALETILLRSDVILVFIDAIILKMENNIHKIRSLTGANEITRILNLVRKTKKYNNILFLLSKAASDLIDPDRDYPGLIQKAKEAYEVFFVQMTTAREAELYKFIPIDCVGFHNVRTQIITVNNKNIYSSDIIGDMEPYNIDVSFAYALSKCIEKEEADRDFDNLVIESRIQELEEEFGSMKQIIDILFHHSKRRMAIAKNKHAHQMAQMNLNELKKYEAELLRIWRGKI